MSGYDFVIVGAALVPFASYVVFAFYCLLIDLLRAILSLQKPSHRRKKSEPADG